jgi:sec-independent protein translocase protein TatA
MNQVLLFGMPGGGELFVIVLVIIMMFGSKKIPELARGLGKGMRELKNVTNDIQNEIRDGAREVNRLKDVTNVEKEVKDMIVSEKEETTDSSTKTPTEENIQEEQFPKTVQRTNSYTNPIPPKTENS